MTDAARKPFAGLPAESAPHSALEALCGKGAAGVLDVILTTSPMGMALLDRTLCFIQVNEPFAAVGPCSVAAYAGRPLQDVVPQLAAALHAALSETLKTGQNVLNIEVALHPEVTLHPEATSRPVTAPRPETAPVPTKRSEEQRWLVSLYPLYGIEGDGPDPAGIAIVVNPQSGPREAHPDRPTDTNENTLSPAGSGPEASEAAWPEQAVERGDSLQKNESPHKCDDRYLILAENSAVGIWHVDTQGYTIYCNPCMCDMLEIDDMSALAGVTYHRFMAMDGLEMIAREHPRRAAGETSSYELEIVGSRGGRRSVCISGAPLMSGSGELESTVGVFMDITERKRADEARIQAEVRYRSLFENAAEGIYQVDACGHYVSVNSSLARIYGFASGEALMKQVSDIGKQLYVDPTRRVEFWNLLRKQGAVQHFEAEISRADGSLAWTSESARAVRDDAGELLYVEGMVEDITQRKNAESQLLHDALHDTLTGLPNRALFMDRLQRALARSDRYEDYRVGLLFFDFDDFKSVNDAMGHVVGDKLLRGIARRLERLIRPEDTLGRLGGDEFALLVDGARDANDAIHVARRILQDITTPFVIEGREIQANASIGIALSQRGHNGAEDLVRDADAAMYRAKAHGRSRYEIFDTGMHTEAMRRMQLESELRPALDEQQFCLQYQPIVSLRTGSIESCEALIRWRHPLRGMLRPAEFTAVAEETGLIVPIDRWVLGEACRFMAAWRKDRGAPDSMSVNLSQRNFSHPDLVEHIDRILSETSLPPECLMLEITENVIMSNAEIAAGTLSRLQDRGIRLSIDDFGTGYSSLSYLHRFPVNMLKIDRSFIGRSCGVSQPMQIVGAIITIAHNLGIEVVAEGVETAAQLAALRDMDCGYGQGYFFSHPLDGDTARALQVSQPAW